MDYDLSRLSAEELKELDYLLTAGLPKWQPLAGPQTMAYESQADIIGYGGAAGGGKSDLACGKALTQHERTMILRREATQLTGIIDRLTQLVGTRDGYNGQDKIWRLDGRQIEFGSTPNAGDETKYQGRPHDFLVFDEATNFLEIQVRFLLGWLRTTTNGQKCQALLTFNPPTSAEGRWVIPFFAPWLDDTHPNPAAPGELRWFATIDGKDVERPNGDTFTHNGETIKPLSRTFIPSRISDNPYLLETGYMATLQSLPEPLRSQMLKGDFNAGMEDDPWQVIPSSWVKAAQARWKPRDKKGEMDSIGSDPARGGRDKHSISRRHGTWFDEMIRHPGTESPNGPVVASQIVAIRRDRAPVHIDMTGWGSSPYDFLVQNQVQVVGVNFAEGTTGRSREGNLKFANRRAEIWWRMREALDPMSPEPIDLPPDPMILADLCAPKWQLGKNGILIESKEDIKERIGRSPDDGDAICLANITTVKAGVFDNMHQQARKLDYDPFAV